MVKIRTERLLLRDWQESDLAPWTAMNADPEVREHLGPLLSTADAAASVRWFQDGLNRNGFGFWAVEVRATGEFIGFAGLDPVDDGMAFAGVEIGWRLARSAWGHGYATEAALAVLDYGYTTLGLSEILAITTPANVRSRAVMQRIGMAYDPDGDFDDPEAEEGSLRRQVLYRKLRDAGERVAAP
jgi:RimJ/RimL family protein N-acetyltransferase